MKKNALLLLLVLSMFKPFAQTITLTFKAVDANTQNSLALDSVNVLNQTLVCDTSVYGAAPTLEIPILSGIDDPQGFAFDLSPNLPNPFKGQTTLTIHLPVNGPLALQMVDNLGKQLALLSGEYPAGTHTFQLEVGEPGLVFLNAHYGNETRSVKLVNTATATGASSIGLLESNAHFTKSVYAINGSGFTYHMGNELIITARAKEYGDNSTKDSPIENKTYTFKMIKCLQTTKIIEITRNSAQAWGKLSSFFALSYGFCWDTTANPSINTSPFIQASGPSPFKSDISGLKSGTLYYIRAFAFNNQDTLYGDVLTFTTHISSNCGSYTIMHQAGAVAPQTKTVTYETVTKLAGEPNKCWILSNLGSDHEASSQTDGSEASAGWYWQFNRKKGYKHEGSTVTPAWTLNWIGEYNDWSISNDPCALELGAEWRIPTDTEWKNIDNVGNWNNTGNPWTSGLRLHFGGRLDYNNGTLGSRSSMGYFWSSTKEILEDRGRAMEINESNNYTMEFYKAYGFSVRCLKQVTGEASVTTIETTAETDTTAISGGIVNWDAGNEVTERGVCWSTATNPTVALSTKTVDGSGVGAFTSLITGLTPNTPYFVRAYATNSIGTSYGQEFSFVIQTCGTQLSINHVAGTTAPVNKTTSYETLTDIAGEPAKCWISQNLGADHQAASMDDSTESAAGWYWQFNCKQGFRHDGAVATPSWIINWIIEQTDWQAANDPCALELGNAWRIPTKTEWENVQAAGNWNNWNGPWNSNLKLHSAGFIHNTSGELVSRGVTGYYWSSTHSSPSIGWSLKSNLDSCILNNSSKSNGYPVRCLSSGIWTASLPTVTTTAAIAITTSAATFGGTVTGDGGSKVTGRGVCWSTSPHPTTALSTKTIDGSCLGSFISHISGLTANTHYFVRAYATNSAGTFYGQELNFIAHVCNTPITIQHTAGMVAPVSKTVTYGTVNNIPGEPNKCWITQNLGASHQAVAYTDATEASAGWYWQFNRAQGYQHDGSTRTPNTPWITDIVENSNWMPSSDPCTLEMGSDWRLPTLAEWGNVKAVGAWDNYYYAWLSDLKLHAAGTLVNNTGELHGRGTTGGYSGSKTQSNFITQNYKMYFYYPDSYIIEGAKAFGDPIRCLKIAASHIIITTNRITNLSLPTAMSGGNITSDGGKEILAKGLCWSTAPNPKISTSTHTLDGLGLGSFISQLNGLSGNTLYYIRAYATTLSDTVYGNELSFVSNYCGGAITINHIAGAVAPVNKTITYGTVDSIPGEPGKCWITQNLGADHQASAVYDSTEASAGWYWRYNHKQGYSHNGNTFTPIWVSTNNYNGDYADWQPDRDPCSAELSNGWRLPTQTEWLNVRAGGAWNNWYGPWNSGLKLHAAGYIGHKTLIERGVSGNYASSRQEGLHHYYCWKLGFSNNYNWVETGLQKYGFSVRCIRDY